jgi:hypothetical protein
VTRENIMGRRAAIWVVTCRDGGAHRFSATGGPGIRTLSVLGKHREAEAFALAALLDSDCGPHRVVEWTDADAG